MNNDQKNERGEECFDMSVFDYSLWKIDEVKDVVLSELDFEEELLPQFLFFYLFILNIIGIKIKKMK